MKQGNEAKHVFPFTKKPEQTAKAKLAGAMIGLTILFGGVGASLLSPGIKDVLIAVLNKYLGLNMPLDTPWQAGLILLTLGIVTLSIAVWAARGEDTHREAKPLIAFRHHSLRNAVPSLLTEDAIPLTLGRRRLSHVDCDLTTQLASGSTSKPNWKAALVEQQKQIDLSLNSLRTLPEAKIAYYGIAHVPLQVLAGRMFGPAVSPQFYELDGDRATWRPLLDGMGTNLCIQRTTVLTALSLADVAIRVSVSFEASLDDVRQILEDPFEDIHISVVHPSRSIVIHVGHIDAICNEFRAALDSLHNRMIPGGRIHLFLAVPMSVGFSLGRVLSTSVNPEVICYNHSAQKLPRYSWGLLVNKNAPPSKLVVRPKPNPGYSQNNLP